MIKNKKLKTLLLSNNNFKDQGAKNIAEVLQFYSFPIENLDLSCNNIGDKGGLEFAKCFASNTSLITVNLR